MQKCISSPPDFRYNTMAIFTGPIELNLISGRTSGLGSLCNLVHCECSVVIASGRGLRHADRQTDFPTSYQPLPPRTTAFSTSSALEPTTIPYLLREAPNEQQQLRPPWHYLDRPLLSLPNEGQAQRTLRAPIQSVQPPLRHNRPPLVPFWREQRTQAPMMAMSFSLKRYHLQVTGKPKTRRRDT